nr:recombinase family protein [Frigidibacter mobilis]
MREGDLVVVTKHDRLARSLNDLLEIFDQIQAPGVGFRSVGEHIDTTSPAGSMAMPFAGRTVVVTHHCPHPDLIGDQQGELAAGYGSDLLGLITRFEPEAWFFGHTHHRHEAQEGQTLVRNVSLGYPQEVQDGDESVILLRGRVSEGA